MKRTVLSITMVWFVVMFSMAQTNVTIYEIQGQQEHSPYEGEVVTTQGIVTGIFGSGYFIQDGPGEWNGVYVYSTDEVSVGDEVELTATVTEYYDLTELKNISSLTVLSSGNELPAASTVSTWDVNDEMYESVLVKIAEATCTNASLGYGEWELDDGSGPCRVDDLGIAYSPVEGTSYSVTGPLMYSYANYKIEPRDENDILIMENLYFMQEPFQTDLQKTSVTLKWQTNVEATTELFWGLTPQLEQGYLNVAGNAIDHEIQLTGLWPAGIYYIGPFSVAGSDTTTAFVRPYATVSNSSGTVSLYFNHDVDYSVAGAQQAVWTAHIADTVIRYLNLAQQTLDITMYEQESDAIVDAVNAAYERGVQVRYITDDNGNNPALEGLNENIPVLYGNTEGIMHDKFIIIDAESEQNAWVITGSLNHTIANLTWDYNNMICFQDQSLAKAFTLEFEEMWGSDGPMYNEENARFGADKTDNTPHLFLTGGIPVELYFSPSDGTTAHIKSVIDQAESLLEFGVMVFTENSLGNAVVGAKERGVDIRGIIDYVEYTGSEYEYLRENDVNVREYLNPDGSQWPDGPVFHHKYAITDFAPGSENPVAITGSHNWSASAESKNDENTVIVYDGNLANQFHQEFSQRFLDLLTPVAVDDDTVTPVNDGVVIPFLENDFLPEGENIIPEIIQMPGNGEAGFDGDSIYYVPHVDFSGKDSLSYRLYNEANPELADTAWIFVMVGNSGIGEHHMSGFSAVAFTDRYSGDVVLEMNSAIHRQLSIRIMDVSGKQIHAENICIGGGKTMHRIGLPETIHGVLLIAIDGHDGRVVLKIIR